MVMNAENRTLKMHICLFAFSSRFTSSDSNGLFPVGIPQTAGVCNPTANIARPLRTHYGCLCQRDASMLHHVQREVQARVQMRIVADGEKFEHRK
ncbi:hypothetical protein AVEN_13081-1 [Araneus ventricosus]|uniref:Uncharacterized protein n=1 Tax=Araneus ventricosus TaxID=182803 RepID=A0A4Y2TI24_ARAVE|nr:hypothetical protein AVEN_13081-1 [Araneus ventricosus]